MLLRFIGTDGSMGLKHGTVYRVHVETWHGQPCLARPVRCPYASDEAFWANWERP